MAEVSISTPRGITLAGTFEDGPGRTAVLFAHGFLSDRHSGGRFDVLATRYREAGHATLQIDLSGCGSSDDDVVTVAREVEDLRSASAWLTEQGYPLQALHAHSFGTLPAMRAAPPDVATMVLNHPLTGPLSYPWEEIFSPVQLDELERYGHARIPDDNTAGSREFSVISRQTLADYSLVDTAALVAAVRVPVLLVHAEADETDTDLVELSREVLPQLPAGSRMEIVRGAELGMSNRIDELAELALAWFGEHLGEDAGPGRAAAGGGRIRA